MTSKKRGTAPVALEGNPGKRVKLASTCETTTHVTRPLQQQSTSVAVEPTASPALSKASSTKKDHPRNHPRQQEPSDPAQKCSKINKLAPPRPFPRVAPSASATGPRSAQKEGANYICLTRKTSLGAYMRKCKDLLINDGYKSLHLHGMGAAIPLLLQLTCALPPILPFSKDEVHIEASTDTVELQDEIIPDDEEEDVVYRTRGKSTLYVIISIGDGQPGKSGSKPGLNIRETKPKPSKSQLKKTVKNQDPLVYKEPEQELVDI